MPSAPSPLSNAGRSLVDSLGRPLRSLRISVTDRCNLRCSYCMPEDRYLWLPRRELLSFSELCLLVECFAELGVERLRLTGGEPLLRRDLDVLVAMLASMPQLTDVALTTNGLELPAQAARLAAAGLQRLTVSLDTLDRERFRRLSKRDGLEQTLAGIEAARRAGFVGEHRGSARLKLDAVIMRDTNDDELGDLLVYAADVGAELRFIEYMDVGGATRWQREKVVSRDEILERIAARYGPATAVAGRGSAPAERFRLGDGRTFGIIASTTQPFCKNCDRSRITADGMWLHCLYAQHKVDLKTPLREGADRAALGELLTRHWRARSDRGAEMRAALKGERRALVPVESLRRDPHLEMHTRGG